MEEINRASRERLLVAVADDDLRGILTLTLAALGERDVTSAASVAEAVEIIASLAVDVVVVDAHLVGDVAALLATLAATPVIVSTSAAEDLVNATDAEFLRMPFDVDDFLDSVAAAGRRSSARLRVHAAVA